MSAVSIVYIHVLYSAWVTRPPPVPLGRIIPGLDSEPPCSMLMSFPVCQSRVLSVARIIVASRLKANSAITDRVLMGHVRMVKSQTAPEKQPVVSLGGARNDTTTDFRKEIPTKWLPCG